jgi:AcrR family transcriptional regulator
MPREARERSILKVTGQVLARRGYHAASMDEIAELASVSKPMLYAYFGSKEGLYVAYLDRTGSELVERLTTAPGSLGSSTWLRSRVCEFLAFVEEYRDGWTVLFTEATSVAPVAAQVSQLRRQLTDAVGRMVEEGTGEVGGLRPPASHALAHAIVGAGESLANWWLENSDIERDQVADWYLALIRGAVACALRSGAVDR